MTKHSADQDNRRLLELSREVSRIAQSLAELSADQRVVADADDPLDAAELPEISVDQVNALIHARRRRADYFSGELFADPAWDMLLDLLEAEIRDRPVSVSSLCIASQVPASTAMRWIKALVEEGLFVRRPDPRDMRRVYIELSPRASSAIRRYFAELNRAG
jgi:DNA-binding MarR family transcriptional regulator